MYKIDKSNKAFPNEDVYFEQLNQQQKIKLFNKITNFVWFAIKSFNVQFAINPNKTKYFWIPK